MAASTRAKVKHALEEGALDVLQWILEAVWFVFSTTFKGINDSINNVLFGERVIEVRHTDDKPKSYPLNNVKGLNLFNKRNKIDVVTFRAVQRVVGRKRGGVEKVLKQGWEITVNDEMRQSSLRIRYLWGCSISQALTTFYKYEDMGHKANAR